MSLLYNSVISGLNNGLSPVHCQTIITIDLIMMKNVRSGASTKTERPKNDVTTATCCTKVNHADKTPVQPAMVILTPQWPLHSISQKPRPCCAFHEIEITWYLFPLSGLIEQWLHPFTTLTYNLPAVWTPFKYPIRRLVLRYPDTCSRYIGGLNYYIVLKVGWHISRNAAEMPVKFPSNQKS